MKVIATSIPDVLIIEPQVFGDQRGFFFESFNQKLWEEKTGLKTSFVQDNHSCSEGHVLRGLHYQVKQPQGKLVRVIAGEIFDVAVDLRKSAPTFGKWVASSLSAENRRMLWIPHGFAHGFLALSDVSEVLYKTTDYWAPEHERTIIWDDPVLAINWPLQREPRLSVKDRDGVAFKTAETF